MSAATSPAPGPDPADVPPGPDPSDASPADAPPADAPTSTAPGPSDAPPADLMRLLDRVAELSAAAPLPEPPFEHPPGEPAADWRRRVATVRAQHDAHARTRRGAVDEAARELFGTDVAGLLFGGAATPSERAEPSPVVPYGDPAGLIRTEFELPVPSDATLLRLAPGLARARARASDMPSPPRRLPVRITAPASPRAAIVRLHGGAFWMGGGTTPSVVDRVLIDALAVGCQAAVIDVDYRLAPEDPFPAAVLDVLHVLDLLRRDGLGLGIDSGIDPGPGRARGLGTDVGIDPSRIAVVGTSSGANVATVATMLEVAAEAPPLAALGLIVPSGDATTAPPPVRDHPEAWRGRQRLLRGYLGPQVAPTSPRVSPALLDTIPGMPPTFAAVARFDEIAVGGEAICRAIRSAGGEAEARVYPMTHTTATPEVEAAVIRDMVEFVAARLG